MKLIVRIIHPGEPARYLIRSADGKFSLAEDAGNASVFTSSRGPLAAIDEFRRAGNAVESFSVDEAPA